MSAEPSGPDPAELVDAFAVYYGERSGHRAAHAKGIVCEGSFTASSEATELTRAQHMQGEPIPAEVRFSNASGVPDAPDWARDRRGMAVKLHLPDDSVTDIVAITLPVFFAREPEEFAELLRSRQRVFAEHHPEARTALGLQRRIELPASYTRAAYHAIHAFRLLDAGDRGTWVRFHWEPDAGVETLAVGDAQRRGSDYLQDALREELARGPATLELVLELAEEGDPLDDATAAWPEGRARVAAGRLELTGCAGDQGEAERRLVFDPTRVPDGVECSQDPMLLARSAAYRLSAERRGAL